jgi:hypothetical protein
MSTVAETKITRRFEKCKCRIKYFYLFPKWDQMTSGIIAKALPGKALRK